MLFAKVNLHCPSVPGGVIAPGHRIPDGLIDPKDVPHLIECGSVQEFEPAPETGKEKNPNVSGKASTAIWNFNPADLESLDLDSLNITIMDHAQRKGIALVEPFDSKEEAIAFMSAEFGK